MVAQAVVAVNSTLDARSPRQMKEEGKFVSLALARLDVLIRYTISQAWLVGRELMIYGMARLITLDQPALFGVASKRLVSQLGSQSVHHVRSP